MSSKVLTSPLVKGNNPNVILPNSVSKVSVIRQANYGVAIAFRRSGVYKIYQAILQATNVKAVDHMRH
jgi:hypothetical protein